MYNNGFKIIAKAVDEDLACYKRWISTDLISQILRTKNKKSKDYCKADENNVYCCKYVAKTVWGTLN